MACKHVNILVGIVRGFRVFCTRHSREGLTLVFILYLYISALASYGDANGKSLCFQCMCILIILSS